MPKSFKKLFILILIFGWVFAGWPQVFNPSTLFRTGFPPEIQKAFATDTTPNIAGTGGNDATVGTQVWTATDEITANDYTDYASTTVDTTSEFGLSSIPDPGISTGHISFAFATNPPVSERATRSAA